MDPMTVLALKEAEVDVEGALRRFSNNSSLYERFLLKFLSDENFDKIKTSVEADDAAEMLTAAHTLKGVTSNLGLNRLYHVCSDMVTRIREDNFEGAKELYPELEAAYILICQTLNKIGEVHG